MCPIVRIKDCCIYGICTNDRSAPWWKTCHDSRVDLEQLTLLRDCGLNFFTAKRRVMEPYLFVPFVHQLPKNWIRLWYFQAMLNRIPIWVSLEGKTPNQPAQVCYEYSVQKTCYGPVPRIRNMLQREGFQIHFQASGHRFRRLVRWTEPIGRRVLGIWSNHFHEVKLSTHLL